MPDREVFTCFRKYLPFETNMTYSCHDTSVIIAGKKKTCRNKAWRRLAMKLDGFGIMADDMAAMIRF